ncbi:phosphatase 2C-like domain-containing protein [Mycena sp. CBHHK59/15]|nr:phosphatase 2C-like domain-containing protein [Mycena sp. CBHHK59/15]
MSNTFETKKQDLHGGITAYQSALQSKGEDRTVAFSFKHGSLIAIFDGHFSAELSEHAAKLLPQFVADSFDPADVDVAGILTKIIEDFDQSLISNFIDLLPKYGWSDASREKADKALGPTAGPCFQAGRLALVGTTVEIGIIDKKKENLWVVSLGDSDTVCTRTHEGKVTPVLLSERHNTGNPAEVERVNSAHPGEKVFYQEDYNRLLGLCAVTRALGDHQFKVKDRGLARWVMPYLAPSYIPDQSFAEWAKNQNDSPPYLSATPDVTCHHLKAGDVLVFASDGLRDCLKTVADAERWKALAALVTGQEAPQLAHARLDATADTNPAQLLIENVLFGRDSARKAEVMAAPDSRDDISVVVVDLGWDEKQ